MFDSRGTRGAAPSDEAPDPRIREALRVLDPGGTDPVYWHRFHRWVMRSAAGELARRRALADLTVSEVVLSWSRTLVPTAVLAAALAGFLLVRGGAAVAPTPSTPGAGQDEAAWVEGIGDLPLPSLLPEQRGGVIFAAEGF